MTALFPGHPLPAAGFEVPLEMLSSCHARIEHQCATLLRLVPYVAQHGADAQARHAAAAVMRYFDTAAQDHHADEEQDLFPALIESMAGSDAVCIGQLIASLIDQHRELDTRWQALRAQLARLAQGEAPWLDSAEIGALVDLYRQHIARENAELLPMAARLLGDEALDHIGRAMRLRRGIHST